MKRKRDPRDEQTRKKLHARAQGRCEKCGRPAPLHGDGVYPSGEWAHINRRWKGNKYSLKNAWWACGGPNGCHRTEHRVEEHPKTAPARGLAAKIRNLLSS